MLSTSTLRKKQFIDHEGFFKEKQVVILSKTCFRAAFRTQSTSKMELFAKIVDHFPS